MRLLDVYYQIKPLIPRRAQLALRRAMASRKRKKERRTWPIHPHSARAPEAWSGWPEGKEFSFILCHDVDTLKGHDQCAKLMELEIGLGFRSSFNFVPEGYAVSADLRRALSDAGFEVGVHGLKHDGKLFRSRKDFDRALPRINQYLKEWGAVGFKAPSMHHNLDWIADFSIEYDTSTFDTDPFEPQSDGLETIFPVWIWNPGKNRGYVELPYTLAQDHGLFVILQETDIDIWKQKLAWIVENGGMAFLNTHPDYMNFAGTACSLEEYPVDHYRDFLEHVRNEYGGRYWHPLPKDMARFWRMRVPEEQRQPRL